ncbi:HD domain-containing protein [Lachnospiraceae bacterium OttesenSCG-928-E19]|nr:HD domain-containing protein [Lachnospiraceae bacterium OttesenSCG-928-E19]
MQRFTTNSYYDDEDMIFVPSSLGGVIDFDRYDKFENILREIIRMPEYWRMSDIAQLGFVEHDIPSAHHTRFVHCIGAFDLMRNLTYFSNRNWKKSRAKSLDFNIKERVAQAGALLHDLGHAFPGHPFERAIKELFPQTYKNHEVWSTEIIQRSGIYNKLNSYDAGFGDKVLNIMAEDDLRHSIWQQVHCGNLNVDTLDYLHRDQSRTKQYFDKTLPRRIIENVKFGKTSDGDHCVILCPGSEIDFHKMLNVRGEMYSDVYFNGASAAAEAFLPELLRRISKCLNTQKYRFKLKNLNNPYVNFIDSGGASYENYLNLTGDYFNSMVHRIAHLQIPGLSEFAAAYTNISGNFSTSEIYHGYADGAPDKNVIENARDEIEGRGGVFKDISIPLYDTNKPEVYCDRGEFASPKKFSHVFPDIVNARQRIVNGYHMKGWER